MVSSSASIDKYLAGYAEVPETPLPEPKSPWEASVVIPFLAENDLIDDCLYSLENAAAAANLRPVIIVVVNANQDHPESILIANQEWMRTFDGERFPNLDFWLVDRNSPNLRFRSKEGVGLARKTGCDFALRLWREGKLRSELLRTTDGDAKVPLDYFSNLTSLRRLGGWETAEATAYCYPYEHHFDESAPREALALTLYEIHLRYYERGLRRAGSLYSYQTLGSTLAFPITSYALARGFPRKNAGEDFYLLNKLAHQGSVFEPSTQPIRLKQRRSDRVPFGTGRATIDLADSSDLINEFTLYDPDGFRGVASVIQGLNSLAIHRSVTQFRKEMERTPWVAQAFERLHGFAAVEHALCQRKEESSLRRHLLEWFDALKTLRLVRARPSIPWRIALDRFELLGGGSSFSFASPLDVLNSLRDFSR